MCPGGRHIFKDATFLDALFSSSMRLPYTSGPVDSTYIYSMLSVTSRVLHPLIFLSGDLPPGKLRASNLSRPSPQMWSSASFLDPQGPLHDLFLCPPVLSHHLAPPLAEYQFFSFIMPSTPNICCINTSICTQYKPFASNRGTQW